MNNISFAITREIKRSLAQFYSDPHEWKIFFEVTTGMGGGRLDGLAFKQSWANPQFRGFEIKTSRGDFKSDQKWVQYLNFCHMFYFVCPKDMIGREEVENMDKDVGLIYYSEDYKNCNLHTMKAPSYRNIDIPTDLLYRIIMSKLESDRYPFHSNKRRYFEEWLEYKRSSQFISFEVRDKIWKRLAEAEKETKRLKDRMERKEETIKRANELIRNLNEKAPELFKKWSGNKLDDNWEEELDKLLSSAMSEGDKKRIKIAINNCESIKEELEKIV